jgi:hypothetical protein
MELVILAGYWRLGVLEATVAESHRERSAIGWLPEWPWLRLSVLRVVVPWKPAVCRSPARSVNGAGISCWAPH